MGGVYVRLFLKEPTFPLRDPTGFLEVRRGQRARLRVTIAYASVLSFPHQAMLRRFTTEAETLIGMTSEDAEKARDAAAAASAAAKAEEAAGGVGARTRADGGGDNALVVRGEDVLTTITHGFVSLLRVRAALAEHVAALGYCAKLMSVRGWAEGRGESRGCCCS